MDEKTAILCIFSIKKLELVNIYIYICRNVSFWFFVFIAILRTKMNLVK